MPEQAGSSWLFHQGWEVYETMLDFEDWALNQKFGLDMTTWLD